MSAKIKLNLDFWVHWLTVSSFVTEETLEKWLPLLNSMGVAGIEFPASMIKVTPKVLAEKLHKYRIREIAFCVFYTGEDEPDPLDKEGDGQTKSVNYMRTVLEISAEIRNHGIEVCAITGPFWIKIGKKYVGKSISDLVEYGELLMSKLDMSDCPPDFALCVEPLQPGEDLLVEGPGVGLEAVRQVGNKRFKLHYDSHHGAHYGVDHAAFLTAAGEYLGWLHASGCMEKTMERRTPGYHLDTVDWDDVDRGTDGAIQAGSRVKRIILEHFSREFKDLVPVIARSCTENLSEKECVGTTMGTLRTRGTIRP